MPVEDLAGWWNELQSLWRDRAEAEKAALEAAERRRRRK